jgi:hypothetical protein
MTDTNDYRAQADVCESVTTSRRLVYELADRADASDHRIAELEADNNRLERWLREQHEDHGWDVQQLFERAEAAERRADALERTLERIAYHPDCTYSAGTMYDLGVTDGHRCAAQIARAAFTDQPAQDGGREYVASLAATPAGYFEGWNDALERCKERVKDPGYWHIGRSLDYVTGYEDGRSDAVKAIRNLQPDQPAQDGGREYVASLAATPAGYFEGWNDAREQAYRVVHRLTEQAWRELGRADVDSKFGAFNRACAEIGNLQPDQPADAGEADDESCDEPLQPKRKYRVKGRIRERRRGQFLNDPDLADDCCARTREECARVAEQYMLEESTRYTFDAGMDYAANKIAAAIRRTGDTGGDQ